MIRAQQGQRERSWRGDAGLGVRIPTHGDRSRCIPPVPPPPTTGLARGQLTSGPGGQPGPNLVRLEGGLTEAGEARGWGGYLRGLVQAWLAGGWRTCVVLLDLRRLLMAPEPPGPSCKRKKSAILR